MDNLRRQAEEQEASLKVQEEELANKKQELEGLKQEESKLEQQQNEFREKLETLSKNLQESQLQISQVFVQIYAASVYLLYIKNLHFLSGTHLLPIHKISNIVSEKYTYNVPFRNMSLKY